MKNINTFSFVELGSYTGQIKALPDDVTLSDIFLNLFFLDGFLSRLLNDDPIKLTYSRKSMEQLLQKIREIYDHRKNSLKDMNFSDPIQTWLVSSLKKAVEDFITNLSAELNLSKTYYVPPVGIYETEQLVEFSTNRFTDAIKYKIPSAVAEDYNASGKCLAFGLYTASGFHSARAYEATVRSYSAYVLSDDSLKQSTNSVGALLDRLEKNTSADEMIVSLIREIKNLSRNPIMHPEQTLSQQDAVVLFDRVACFIQVVFSLIPIKSAAAIALASELSIP